MVIIDPSKVNKIGEGETSNVYDYTDGTIIKVYKEDYAGLDGKHVELEYANLEIAYHSGLFVPKPYKILNIENQYGIVMQKISGEKMSHSIKHTEDKMFYATILGKLHREWHSKKIRNVPIPNAKSVYFGQLSKMNNTFLDIKNDILEVSESIEDGMEILHGDFVPYNIAEQNGKYYILDCAELLLGNYYFDIARTIMFLSDINDPINGYYISCVNERDRFIKEYIQSYFRGSNYNSELLNKAICINCIFEIMYGDEDRKNDPFFNDAFDFIHIFIKDNKHQYIKDI